MAKKNKGKTPKMWIKCSCGRTLATATFPRDEYGEPLYHGRGIWGLIVHVPRGNNNNDVYQGTKAGVPDAEVYNFRCDYTPEKFTRGLYRPRDERRDGRRACGRTYSVRGETILKHWQDLAGITEHIAPLWAEAEKLPVAERMYRDFSFYEDQMNLEREYYRKAGRHWEMVLH